MKPHEANQVFWDASIRWWKEKDQRGLWMKAHEDPLKGESSRWQLTCLARMPRLRFGAP